MTNTPAGPAARLYRSLLVMVVVIALGLIAAVILVSIQNARTSERLAALEEYVAGRGEFRDREAVRMEAASKERLRRFACELLDTFPAGVPSLERPRAKYDCGPGIPLDQLTPDEQAQLRGAGPAEPGREPTVAPAAPTAAAPFSGGAVGRPAPPPQQPPAPTRPPMPTTVPAQPTSPPLGPLTDTVCAVTGVCP